MPAADIGLIGLAVMGQNLALNMNDHGYQVSVHNRTASKISDFLDGPASATNITGFKLLEDFVSSLKAPRKIILMIRAGNPVDELIRRLLPLLDAGDIIIDGGNSRFTDSNRRYQELSSAGYHFIATGISGGEEGARHGPSIMPGGDSAAWPAVKNILQDISAKVADEACCQWVGEAGSGHYVKMVHNGIEYGDMQLIAEAYHLMRVGLAMSVEEIQVTFAEWNKGVLDSYLIEITANILALRNDQGEAVIDTILDAAGQKGTGKWTGINALELGVPLSLIGEAVFARCLSAIKDERSRAQSLLSNSQAIFEGDRESVLGSIHDGLYASKIISYAQGFMLMREAATEYNWALKFSDIALMWQGGCIIRSRFLGNIRQAYEENKALENLLLDKFFIGELMVSQAGWREAVTLGVQLAIPLPAMSSALAFFDGYRRANLPANLIQAQRDYFGAHSYERVDRPRGEFFHTDWTGQGGDVPAGRYEV